MLSLQIPIFSQIYQPFVIVILKSFKTCFVWRNPCILPLSVVDYIPRDLAGASVWMGGSDQTTNSAWGWSDGKPFSYMNWDGILQRPEKLSRCIGMKMIGKTWVAEPCAVKQPYMCKKLSKLQLHNIRG